MRESINELLVDRGFMPGLPVSSKDHHFIAVNRACDMGADSLLGHEIDFHVDGLPDLVFDLYQLDQAFWAGKPDQDVNIAARSVFSTGIGTKDSDPLSAMPGKNCNNRLPDLLLLVCVLSSSLLSRNRS